MIKRTTGITLGSDNENFGVFQGIKLNVNFGVDYRSQNKMSYMNMYHGNQAAAGGMLDKTNSRMQSYTFNQLLTWNRSFGLHNFDVMAGHEFYAYKYEYLEAGKTNLVDGILELRPGTTMYAADSYTDNYRIESWLGRINYNYDEKYYVSTKTTVGVHSGLSVVTGVYQKKPLCRTLSGLTTYQLS